MDIFDLYANAVEDQFDEGLIITYENFVDKPVFKIVYDSSVDLDELEHAIPKEWRQLQDSGQIKIVIQKYVYVPLQHSDRFKEANARLMRTLGEM